MFIVDDTDNKIITKKSNQNYIYINNRRLWKHLGERNKHSLGHGTLRRRVGIWLKDAICW